MTKGKGEYFSSSESGTIFNFNFYQIGKWKTSSIESSICSILCNHLKETQNSFLAITPGIQCGIPHVEAESHLKRSPDSALNAFLIDLLGHCTNTSFPPVSLKKIRSLLTCAELFRKAKAVNLSNVKTLKV